jgi:hypothetical protein
MGAGEIAIPFHPSCMVSRRKHRALRENALGLDIAQERIAGLFFGRFRTFSVSLLDPLLSTGIH